MHSVYPCNLSLANFRRYGYKNYQLAEKLHLLSTIMVNYHYGRKQSVVSLPQLHLLYICLVMFCHI